MSDSTTVETAAPVELKPAAKEALRERRKTGTKPKQQPPYSVVLHNDSINGFGWVVGVVRKTFRYSMGKAFLITLRAHCFGRSVAWVGSLEVAEFKAQQLTGQGPDPIRAVKGARPLKATVEPTA